MEIYRRKEVCLEGEDYNLTKGEEGGAGGFVLILLTLCGLISSKMGDTSVGSSKIPLSVCLKGLLINLCLPS